MNNLNSILVEGNLVRDPVMRTTPKGTSVVTMTIASNRYYKNETGFEKEVSFFDVECWSKLAESVYSKGKKGRGTRIVGRLRQDRWVGSDGNNRARICIVAEHVEFRPEFKKDLDSKELTDDEKKAFYQELDDESSVDVDEEAVVETAEDQKEY